MIFAVAVWAVFGSSVTQSVCCPGPAGLLCGQSWFELLKQGAGIWASRSTCICNSWQFHLCWPKVKKSSKVKAAFTFSHPCTSCSFDIFNSVLPDENSTKCLRCVGTILKDARRNLIKVPVTDSLCCSFQWQTHAGKVEHKKHLDSILFYLAFHALEQEVLAIRYLSTCQPCILYYFLQLMLDSYSSPPEFLQKREGEGLLQTHYEKSN